jgi:hypothetical protein
MSGPLSLTEGAEPVPQTNSPRSSAEPSDGVLGRRGGLGLLTKAGKSATTGAPEAAEPGSGAG